MICAQAFFHRFFMINNIAQQPSPVPAGPKKAGEPEHTPHHMVCGG